MARYFAASYQTVENLIVTRRNGIVGFRSLNPNYLKGFLDLKPGDMILLRNASDHATLKFDSHCVVTNAPFKSSELTWPDELSDGRVLYPHRVRVDFDDVPLLPGLYLHDWIDWLRLGWHTQKGLPYTKHKLALVLAGRYLPPERNDEARSRFDVFLTLEEPYTPTTFKGRNTPPTDLVETGYMGEKHVYELLKKRFPHAPQRVEWSSQLYPYSLFDFQVFEGGGAILYVEVKATVNRGPVAFGYISSGEWKVREQNPNKHELYFVVFDRTIDDPHPAMYRVDNDCRTDAIKWRLEVSLEDAVRIM